VKETQKGKVSMEDFSYKVEAYDVDYESLLALADTYRELKSAVYKVTFVGIEFLRATYVS
jgi:hypothetical protein